MTRPSANVRGNSPAPTRRAQSGPCHNGAPVGKGSSVFRGVSWHKDNCRWRATIFKGAGNAVCQFSWVFVAHGSDYTCWTFSLGKAPAGC